ncbi:MAG: hypothetical protein FJY67_09110, partial [Calditrichaeota bacterium]|nr:hypothetical protein [Calditrichota bacterium]
MRPSSLPLRPAFWPVASLGLLALVLPSALRAMTGMTTLSGNTAQLVSSGAAGVVIRAELPELPINITFDPQGSTESQVRIEGEPSTYHPGMPILPSVARMVIVPGATNLELVVDHSDPIRVRAERPPAILIGEEGEACPVETPDGIYPPVVAEMEDPVIIRGHRIVKVVIYPVRYDLNTGEYLHYLSVEVAVRPTEGRPVNPVYDPPIVGDDPFFLQWMSEYVLNGDDIRRDDPARDRLPANVGHYLIVTQEAAMQYLVPFIEWRRKAGYRVDILALSSGDASSDNTVKQRIQQRWDALRQAGQPPFGYLHLVGDRTAYENPPAPGWVLQSPVGTSSWPNAQHGEYLYACMDGGNDNNPDVAFSRWPGGSQETLQLMVGRTLGYEANPYMENTEWFRRAAAYSSHWGNSPGQAWHATIPTTVRWAESALKAQGFNLRWFEDREYDRTGQRVGDFWKQRHNERTNLMFGRAEFYLWAQSRSGGEYRPFNDSMRNVGVFPVDVHVSGHGEWGAEAMYRTGSGNNLKGPVATTNGWGFNPTTPWNMQWMEMVSGILQKKLPTGWSFARSHNLMDLYLPADYTYNARNARLLVRTDINHFAEPGLLPWMDVPRIVAMEFTPQVAPDTRLIEAFVHLPDSDEPVVNAQVTLYAPGNVPQQMGDYINFTPAIQRIAYTDDQGRVRYVLSGNERFVASSRVYLTVTGRDIKPFFGERTVANPAVRPDIAGWTLEQITGNDDEFVNPGETFLLYMRARNLGTADAISGLNATIRTLSPYVTIDPDNNGFWFGDVEAGQAVDGDQGVLITISPLCPDGVARPALRPLIEVNFAAGEERWTSALRLEPRASHLEYRRTFIGNAAVTIVPDSVAQIDIELMNVGQIPSPPVRAELRTMGLGISVVESQVTFEAIAPGERGRAAGGSRFTISGNRIVPPGLKNQLQLVLLTDDGPLDTTFLELQVMQPRANAPFGPDGYGYICFDNTDTLWDVAPRFEWVEIANPQNRTFNGTRLNFSGQSPNDQGEAMVIPLGFETQFYGQVFDSITVCTNGFVTAGSHVRALNFQRWPLDQAVGGAAGMMAPLWTELRHGEGAGVYVFHDTSDSRFIVEWYRMRIANGQQTEVTFQLIIYDRSVWITESGDQNILFQYLVVVNPDNVRGGDPLWEKAVPYSSVGISDPLGRTGVNYTWNNQYPNPGAAQLANRRSILFSTSPRFRAGTLYGWVRDAATWAGIPNAIVFTKHGFTAFTDEEGYWRIAEALAEVPFEITARKQGYNDSTKTEIEDGVPLMVPEGDSLEISFELLHPEFLPSTDNLWWRLEPDNEYQIPFDLFNGGNGPLTWSAEKRLIGDANAAPW